MLSSVQLLGYHHTDSLQNLYEQNQNDDRNEHDVCLVTVITVADRNITKSAATDNTCHCGVTEDRSDRDRQTDEKGGTASARSTFQMIVIVPAPILCAASITPLSTSFKEDSTIRPIKGAAAKTSGTTVAATP